MFTSGNKLWTLRERSGKRPTFETGEELIAKAIEYFEWCEENPITEEVVGWYQGEPTTHEVTKLRAFTIMGLCAFIGVDRQSWSEWRKKEALNEAILWLDDIMYEQKFTGAAAGVLNASIIGRDLGLAEKSELSNPDGTLKPTIIEFVTPQVVGKSVDEG